MYNNILHKSPVLKPNVSNAGRELLEGLLQKDRTKRLGVKDDFVSVPSWHFSQHGLERDPEACLLSVCWSHVSFFFCPSARTQVPFLLLPDQLGGLDGQEAHTSIHPLSGKSRLVLQLVTFHGQVFSLHVKKMRENGYKFPESYVTFSTCQFD